MVKFQCLGSGVSEMGGREGRDSETQDAQEENGVDRQINFIHHSSTHAHPPHEANLIQNLITKNNDVSVYEYPVSNAKTTKEKTKVV
jgi:hypothetical protein